MTPFPTVAVVVLNWNRLSDILECLESLHRLSYQQVRVVVVDNGSTDGSVPIIRQRHPAVAVVQNGRNLGFAGGNNVGIRHAMLWRPDYFWLLNNDTVVESDALSILVEAAESLPQTGLFSPAIHYSANPEAVQFPGSYIDWDRFDTIFCTEKDAVANGDIGSNVVLWGTALLVKRVVVERIGLLDETFFAYEEDIDYCVRSLRAGLGCRPVNAARVYHKDTPLKGGWKSPSQAYLRARNSYFFWMKHLPPSRRPLYLRKYLAGLFMQAGEMKAEGLHQQVEALFEGAWNAFAGRGGDPASRLEVPGAARSLFHRMLRHPFFWQNIFAGDYLTAGTGFLRRVLRR